MDHIVCDLKRFGSLSILSASPYEHFNLYIKEAYRSTSKRHLTRTCDTIRNLDTNIAVRHVTSRNGASSCSSSITSPTPLFGLVPHGECIPLQCMDSTSSSSKLPIFKNNDFITSLRNSFDEVAVSQFRELVNEELERLDVSMFSSLVQIVVVQSGYVLGGFVPTLEDCSSEEDQYVLSEPDSYGQLLKRFYGI